MMTLFRLFDTSNFVGVFPMLSDNLFIFELPLLSRNNGEFNLYDPKMCIFRWMSTPFVKLSVKRALFFMNKKKKTKIFVTRLVCFKPFMSFHISFKGGTYVVNFINIKLCKGKLIMLCVEKSKKSF